MQAKGFSQDKQATGGKDTPMDVRGGRLPSPLLHKGNSLPAVENPVCLLWPSSHQSVCIGQLELCFEQRKLSIFAASRANMSFNCILFTIRLVRSVALVQEPQQMTHPSSTQGSSTLCQTCLQLPLPPRMQLLQTMARCCSLTTPALCNNNVSNSLRRAASQCSKNSVQSEVM